MKDASEGIERRGSDRPRVGDWKTCPICADGMLVFTEKYRAAAAPPSTADLPAWVCDKCPNVTFARAQDPPSAVGKTSRRLREEAGRSLMKSRFVRSQADRASKKSRSRKP